MKRSEYDRPKHPIGDNRPPISDTWRCPRCKVIRPLSSGWKIIGQGRERRRLCKPCWEAR